MTVKDWGIRGRGVIRPNATSSFLLLFLMLGMIAPWASAAPAADAMGAVLERSTDAEGPLAATVGEDLILEVGRKLDGQPLSDAIVDWSVEDPRGATLSSERSNTSAADAADGAGIARTRFRAMEPGRYVVIASSKLAISCVDATCERMPAVKFDIDVSPAVTGTAATPSAQKRSMFPAVLAGAAALGGTVALLTSDGNDAAQIRTLFLQGGDRQSGLPNSALPTPLAVHALNDGKNASGVSIIWTATGGASLSASTTTTDRLGIASVTVTSLGPGPGPVLVTATRSDGGGSVQFTLVVLIRELQIVSGNGQSAPTDTSLPEPLVVRAALSGAPQAGVGINWTIVSGDASITSVSNGGLTDSAGLSSATISLGPTPGSVVISAARADAPTIVQTFVVNATLTRTLSVVSGDGQTAPPNAPLPSPLVVNAQNNGAPIAGVTINWMASGGAVLSSATSVTDASGNASVTVTNTGPGPDPVQVVASRADDPTVSVFFDQNILPPMLTLVSGDGQSGLTGNAAPLPLLVRLQDGAGVPVAGQLISWSVLSGSATLAGASSVTDAAGEASMNFSFGSGVGPISIEASAYSGAQSVTFSADTLAASGITKSGGDAQSGNPGVTLLPMTITIAAPPGSTNLSGVPVTFSIVSGTGTLSVTNTVTDAAGQASTVLTLGLTPGTVTVLAQVAGGQSTTFTATINGTLVGTVLTIISGNNQTLAAGAVSAPITAELTDGTAPLAGFTINWSTNNGTLSNFSSVTDASGRATTTATASVSGPVVITASFVPFAQYTGSSTSAAATVTLASIAGLPTDEASVAVALDNACAALAAAPGTTLTPEEQDLLDQCQALASASAAAPTAVVEALAELLPDVAKTQAQSGQTAINAQFDNIAGRLVTLRSGGYGSSLAGLGMLASGGRIPLFSLAQSLLGDEPAAQSGEGNDFSRWGVFASGTIGRGDSDAQENSPAYDFDVNGLTLGVDYRRTDKLIIGAALGYTSQDTTLVGGEGSVDVRGFSTSTYISWFLRDSWYLDGMLSFGHNRFSHNRRIRYALPQADGSTVVVDQQANASSDGGDTSANVTFGRDFQRKAWSIGVYGKALYTRLDFDSFEEELEGGSQGSGLGLRVDSRTVTALSSVLGLKLTRSYSADWGVFLPHAQLEWQNEYSGDPDLFRAFLIEDPTNTPILVTGTELDNSYFRLGLGMSFVLPRGRSGFMLYERMLARHGMTQETLALGFRVEF